MIKHFLLVQQFLKIAKDNPGLLPQLLDSVSDGQLLSKQWLITELEKIDIDLGNIFLCAGWYATLAYMLFESKCNIKKIRSFDIDNSCCKIAETINKSYVKDNWKFKASTLNIHDLEYNNFSYITFRFNGSALELSDTADTIINTSCEHIENFSEWYNNIPFGKIIILQTNNYIEIDDHVNCATSLANFADNTPMTSVLYSGQIELEKYTRYMRIGIK